MEPLRRPWVLPIIVVAGLVIATINIIAWQAHLPAGVQKNYVVVNGARYAHISDGIPSPPPRSNCTSVSPDVGTNFDLGFEGVRFRVQSWWNCTSVQNVSGYGVEQNGTVHGFAFPVLPPVGANQTWISPDLMFGVLLSNLANGPVTVDLLVRA